MRPTEFNPDNTIVGMRIFRNGSVEVVRRSMPTTPPRGERNDITMLTQKSRNNMLFTVSATNVEFKSMITLTYPNRWPNDGEEVKMHLKLFRQKFERCYDASIFWFMEFQKRGAPHFHILTSKGGVDQWDRNNLAYMWSNIAVPEPDLYAEPGLHRAAIRDRASVWSVHSHHKSWEMIRQGDGAIRYMAKYSLKAHQKEVPSRYKRCGRFWGCSKSVRDGCQPISEVDCDASSIRAILEAEGHRVADYDWLPKQIFGVKSLDELDTK